MLRYSYCNVMRSDGARRRARARSLRGPRLPSEAAAHAPSLNVDSSYRAHGYGAGQACVLQCCT